MGTMLGMDPELVRELAANLKTHGTTIREMIAPLSSAIESAPWVGADRDGFHSDWTSTHVPGLNSIAEALEAAGNTAEQNATEQENTSSGGGVLSA